MSGPAQVKAKPATPRHAASLVLIRQGSDGPEVLMGRRPRKSAFAPDVFVFPGGKLDEADRMVRPAVPLSEACIRLTAASRRLAHALAAAALRETEEETGLILPLASGAGADFSHLTLIARAITPPYRPKRFDARFFMAEAEHLISLERAPDCGELDEIAWVDLDEALALDLPNITRFVMHELALRLEDPHRPAPFVRFLRGSRQLSYL